MLISQKKLKVKNAVSKRKGELTFWMKCELIVRKKLSPVLCAQACNEMYSKTSGQKVFTNLFVAWGLDSTDYKWCVLNNATCRLRRQASRVAGKNHKKTTHLVELGLWESLRSIMHLLANPVFRAMQHTKNLKSGESRQLTKYRLNTWQF